MRPRLDFVLSFQKTVFFHKSRSDWSKLRLVFSFPLKFQNLFFYHPMVLGGCYHNTSTLSSLLVLTLFLCYTRYMPCHLYFTISTLPCIYTTRTLLNLYDISTGILQVRKQLHVFNETDSEQMIKKIK